MPDSRESCGREPLLHRESTQMHHEFEGFGVPCGSIAEALERNEPDMVL